MHTPHRRTTALAGLALALAPVLSSCGFDYATDRDYTPGVATNARDGKVDVLGAVIVAAESGEAVFVSSFANSFDNDESTLESITSEGLTFSGLEDVTLPPNGFANLAASDSPVTVEGDLEPGTFVEVTLDFSHGDSVSLDVPVRPNCGDYAEIPGVPSGDEVCEVATAEDH
ncbi:hypothetical protein [Nocardioides solisilvae]|uniref:hypothetical protein n=1 Tax=Nocardioides solisilvae TaxID=1542435 RepID=UPI000D750B86|nr:hypothetical protein [Nocardioides solisilvae]